MKGKGDLKKRARINMSKQNDDAKIALIIFTLKMKMNKIFTLKQLKAMQKVIRSYLLFDVGLPPAFGVDPAVTDASLL